MNGVFDVRDYGALGDNSTDDTAAFAAAIDAAAALPSGGVVQVPPGQYYVDQIRMKSQVTLAGFGPSSVIRKNSGLNTPLVGLDKDNTNFTVLRDLRLRGNKYGGGGGGAAHGIDYYNTSDGNVIKQAELYLFHADAQHRIFNVKLDAIDGHGIRLTTREAHVDHCMRGDVTGDGLVIDGSDNWVSHTSLNWIGRRGVVVNGGNNRLVALKAWYIGTDASFSDGDGFVVQANRQTLIGCEAQDVSRYGLHLLNADECLVYGMMLDNIGNFFKNQNQGFDHPILDGAIKIYGGVGISEFNRIDAIVAQRSPECNIESFVRFASMSQNNSVCVSGNYEAYTLTPLTISRSDDETAYNNLASVNGRVA